MYLSGKEGYHWAFITRSNRAVRSPSFWPVCLWVNSYHQFQLIFPSFPVSVLNCWCLPKQGYVLSTKSNLEFDSTPPPIDNKLSGWEDVLLFCKLWLFVWFLRVSGCSAPPTCRSAKNATQTPVDNSTHPKHPQFFYHNSLQHCDL